MHSSSRTIEPAWFELRQNASPQITSSLGHRLGQQPGRRFVAPRTRTGRGNLAIRHLFTTPRAVCAVERWWHRTKGTAWSTMIPAFDNTLGGAALVVVTGLLLLWVLSRWWKEERDQAPVRYRQGIVSPFYWDIPARPQRRSSTRGSSSSTSASSSRSSSRSSSTSSSLSSSRSTSSSRSPSGPIARRNSGSGRDEEGRTLRRRRNARAAGVAVEQVAGDATGVARPQGVRETRRAEPHFQHITEQISGHSEPYRPGWDVNLSARAHSADAVFLETRGWRDDELQAQHAPYSLLPHFHPDNSFLEDIPREFSTEIDDEYDSEVSDQISPMQPAARMGAQANKGSHHHRWPVPVTRASSSASSASDVRCMNARTLCMAWVG